LVGYWPLNDNTAAQGDTLQERILGTPEAKTNITRRA